MGKLVKNGISYTGGSGASSYNELNDKPQINGVTLSGNKTPDALGLVTKAVNDLVNYYLKTETYSKTEVDTIVSNIKNSRFEVVATLPTSDIKTNVIYLVPKADAESGDIKDEYINLDGTTAGWERIGSTEVDLSNYVSVDDLNTALADYTTTTDLTALLANKQDKLQYSTLPTASAELEGKIFEYTGATGNGLTHGYFYECVSDGENPATYSWQQTNVQPSSGGGGSYTAGDGIDITNDVISTKQSEAGDIDEIVDVYPQAGNLVSIVNAFNKGDIYSTDEKMIGQWTDGKPLYQKVLQKSFSQISDITRHWVTLFTTSDGMPSNIDFGVVKEQWLQPSISSVSDFDSPTSMPIVDYDNGVRLFCDTKVDKTTNTIVALSNYPQWINSDSFVITVVLNYTKTTDVAISIGEATEYSTDEKVVGTWIDGKPVYQKTITLTSDVAHGEYINISTNIENVVYFNGYVIATDEAYTRIVPWVVANYYFTFNRITSTGVQLEAIAGGNPSKIKAGSTITFQYTKTTT